MNRRIKVLQLHPNYNIKSQDFADLGEQIFKALPPEQFETVTGFLHGQPAPGEPESCADRSIYFNFSKRQMEGLRLSAMRRLYSLCREERFDVVICNLFKPVNLFLRLNPWLKIPRCIGIVHGFGNYDRLTRRLETRLLIDQAWRFVGVSPAVRQYLLELNSGFTERNTCAILNAIDIKAARKLQRPRDAARAALGLPADAFVFGAIGRLVPIKGHTHLIDAFARMRDAMPRAMLVIIGEGRARPDLESAIRQHGLQDRILLPGMLPEAQQYMRAFDTFVMPSLSEGLGLVLLEAMSAEVPAIASDIPAVASIMRAAGGALILPGDEDALAAALLHHFQSPQEARLQRGQRAFAYLNAHHTITHYREQYLKLIRDGDLDTGKE